MLHSLRALWCAISTSTPKCSLVAVFSERKSGKKVAGSENLRLQEYSGAFYYHRDRLIVPLKRFACQQKTITAMLTTERRIKTLGFGLLAVCRENYLTAGHNKSAYVARNDAVDEQKLPPAGMLFNALSAKADKLLQTKVGPAVDRIMGKAPPAGAEQETIGGKAAPKTPPCVAAHKAQGHVSVEEQQEREREAEAASKLVLDAFMRAEDGRAGRVVRCAGGWFMLRDHDGSVGVRKYRALQLSVESFDPIMHQQLPAPLAPMLGGSVKIW